MANKVVYTGGSSILTILFVVFLVLKLTHLIGWSWWWVTVTLWLPLALGIIIWTLVAIFGRKRRRSRRG